MTKQKVAIKNKFKIGFKKQSNEWAISFRKELGLTARDYLPAIDLAQHLSIRLLTPSQINNLSQDQTNRLINLDKSRWSGATFACYGIHYIIYNESHAQTRIESTIMHEISHILCKHEPSIPLHNGDLSVLLRDFNEQHELEANWLGSCLQLPREGLIWALRRGMSERQIGNHYRASLDMTRYRIRVSGAQKQVEREKKHYKR